MTDNIHLSLERCSEVRGGEFDWLASDANGDVALFCTAGSGLVVPSLLPTLEGRTEEYFEAVFNLLNVLPAHSDYKDVQGGMGSDIDTPKFGQRGFYVYDWDRTVGPYLKRIVPTQPVPCGAVAPYLPSHFRMVPKVEILFSATDIIRPADR